MDLSLSSVRLENNVGYHGTSNGVDSSTRLRTTAADRKATGVTAVKSASPGGLQQRLRAGHSKRKCLLFSIDTLCLQSAQIVVLAGSRLTGVVNCVLFLSSTSMTSRSEVLSFSKYFCKLLHLRSRLPPLFSQQRTCVNLPQHSRITLLHALPIA